MADIGFIGLGIMGRPMVRNLMKAGHTVTVYDIVGTAVEEMATDGAKAASSSKEVAENNRVIITMVPDGPDAEVAIMGPNGVLEGAASGSVVIDMSSIAPASSQRIGAACDGAGVDFMDAPVSGGEPGAVAGTLAIMVGGKKDVYDRYIDTFGPLGSSTYCGGYGAGNTTKLANQIIVALNIAAVSEALVLSRKAGLDPEVVFNAIKGGLAGSTVLNAKAPMMIAGNFNPGFRIKLHQKDLNNALQTARELGVPLPFTAMAQQVIGSLMNEGKGELDHSAIANFIEDMAQTKINGQ
ncbi:MAG: 2-hydroxy-3-oxopropionate reductase [Chloroflexi bacterium]|nr:2-hydroxy-3-oxopropionate reductase [Chloroflexota bacterium]MDA1226747.1 2-hydroxy-3-oxopropionate reductase [Chloroflexota bacterium]